MFRLHRAICRQHIIKESTILRTLSMLLLRYVIIILNFGVINNNNNVLPEDGRAWPKHVTHKRGIYILIIFLHILMNIFVN
jgi:hypothetical protein